MAGSSIPPNHHTTAREPAYVSLDNSAFVLDYVLLNAPDHKQRIIVQLLCSHPSEMKMAREAGGGYEEEMERYSASQAYLYFIATKV